MNFELTPKIYLVIVLMAWAAAQVYFGRLSSCTREMAVIAVCLRHRHVQPAHFHDRSVPVAYRAAVAG